MFEALGVTALEEKVYRTLVDSPRLTAVELAEANGVTTDRIRRAVRNLERSGLVHRRAGPPARYLPAPPDVAVETLILRRQEELHRARLDAVDLLERFRRQALFGPQADLVEAVRGREATRQCSDQLMRGARHEVLIFDKPPYAGPLDNKVEMEVLARGVRWRAVYAAEALAPSGRLEQFRIWHGAGEQARVAPALPIKLLIVDGRQALLPLVLGDDDASGSAILVHRCALLAALTELFEVYWRRGIPIPDEAGGLPAGQGGHSGAAVPDSGSSVLEPGDRGLLLMLTAGLKDEAIARQLGVSLRTARRRLARLLRSSGVETRFQLGLVAARNGWLTEHGSIPKTTGE